MVVGDMVGDFKQVANGEYMQIRPSASQEWVIHNIYHEGPAELYVSNGTVRFKVDEDSEGGTWSGFFFHVRYDLFLEVLNVDTVQRYMAFDGVQTK